MERSVALKLKKEFMKRTNKPETASAGQNGGNSEKVEITEITICRGECAGILVQVENATSDWFTVDGLHIFDSHIKPYGKITKGCCAFHRNGDSVLLTEDERDHVARSYLDKLPFTPPKPLGTMMPTEAKVLRDGRWQRLPAMDLVVGDTVLANSEEK
jgi:hypothetical protein